MYDVAGGWLGLDQSADVQAKKCELLELKAQLAKVSAMDEFARWARLRRQMDKLQSDYDQARTTDHGA